MGTVELTAVLGLLYLNNSHVSKVMVLRSITRGVFAHENSYTYLWLIFRRNKVLYESWM
jgi:hypothetical protein